MSQFLLVGLGGFFGAICRFFLSRSFRLTYLATLLVNMTGASGLVLLFSLYHSQIISYNIWLLFGIGFCGAYTTFSTFSYEAVQLILNKQYRTASIYSLFSFTFLLVSLLFMMIFIK